MSPATAGSTSAGSSTTEGPAVASSRRLVLVRHGETEWSKSGQHTGRTDLPLTENGRAAALALRPLLRTLLGGRPPALALTSPALRASTTAELAGIDVDVEADLREVDYGRYEGITTPQIREQDPGWTIWTGAVPDGETVEVAGTRVDRVLARLPSVGDVVLFAHGHILRILAARWLGLPACEGRLFALDTATVSVLGTEHDQPVVRRWNVSAGGWQ